MKFFDFFNKRESRAEKLEQFEKLLTQTTCWKFKGIRSIYLDVDFGHIFLDDITLNKNKKLTLSDLKSWARNLHDQDSTFSKADIEKLSQQAGFNLWEAFDWKKEYFETIRNINNITLSF